MKPERSTTEQQLADRLREHEFVFQPEAWASLEQQLVTPPTTTPGPQSDTPVGGVPGAAWLPQTTVWVGGWLIAGLFSVLLGGKNLAPATPAEVLPSTMPQPLATVPSEAAPTAVTTQQIQTTQATQSFDFQTFKLKKETSQEAKSASRAAERATPVVAEKNAPVVAVAPPQVAQTAAIEAPNPTLTAAPPPPRLSLLPRALREAHSEQQQRLPKVDSVPEPAFGAPGQRWHYGLAFGAQWTNLRNDAFNLHLSPALYGGAFVEYLWKPGVRLQAELNGKWARGYDFQAIFTGQFSSPLGDLDSWGRIARASELAFVQVPLTAHWQSERWERLSWVGGVRPALVLPLNGTEETWCTCGANPPGEAIKIRQGLRWFDLGLVAGLEWRFNPRWTADLRLNAGLFDLSKDNFFNSATTVTNTDLAIGLRRYLR